MTDQERIAELEAALEYAINRCDQIIDGEHGGPDTDDGIERLRVLLPNAKWEVER